MFGRSLDPETDMLVTIGAACRNFNCLPRSGSLFDQDCYLAEGLPIVFKWLNKKEDAEIKKGSS